MAGVISTVNAIALLRLGRGHAKQVRGVGWVREYSDKAGVNGARVAVLEELGLFDVTGVWHGGDDGGNMGCRSIAGHRALVAAFPHAILPARRTGAWHRFVEAERDIAFLLERKAERRAARAERASLRRAAA